MCEKDVYAWRNLKKEMATDCSRAGRIRAGAIQSIWSSQAALLRTDNEETPPRKRMHAAVPNPRAQPATGSAHRQVTLE